MNILELNPLLCQVCGARIPDDLLGCPSCYCAEPKGKQKQSRRPVEQPTLWRDLPSLRFQKALEREKL
jgi:hypothetical protein